MTYSTSDTDWAESQGGNQWRRLGGVPLIVGRSKNRKLYWASVDYKFLQEQFETPEEAKAAAETEFKRQEQAWYMEKINGY
jgi:hypothetical protein